MKALKVWFDSKYIFVETVSNQIGKMPLEWFPKLLAATDLQKAAFELWADGEWIHWEEIGEDLGVEGFFNYNKQAENLAISK